MTWKVCAKMLNGDVQYEKFETKEEAEAKLNHLFEVMKNKDVTYINRCVVNGAFVLSAFIKESTEE